MPPAPSSPPPPGASPATPANASARLDRVQERFEDAWRAGGRPDLEAFLAEAGPGERLALLVELAHTELHYRLAAGEPARAEEYLGRFPELRDDPAAALGLIEAEYELRRQREPGLEAEEYLRRFPEHAAALPTLLRGPAAGGRAGGPAAAPADTPAGRDGESGRGSPGGPAGRGVAEAGPGPELDAAKRLPGSAPAYPTIPGFEILGTLGRGGMGVVYQARQIRLERIVALKMILAGEHAGPEELERFRAEARAVAALQHPHIVQIFEVGQHHGLPFFALEYLEGGSLAQKLQESPLPAPAAAALVETLARAMQAAHQRGIIHRDLKPANVLLDAAGRPKITDFGLAKRVEGGGGLTQTGAIVGTPSYMAPEQAAGRGKAVGVAADVYALGAVLYELLTGRPPFKAATVMETVLQVLSDDPVPPSRLQPKLPSDLETVCLKCLHKDPARRYADAAGLAEDLRRYQAGEPIRARPVGVAERGLRWVRRNPVVAGLAAAVVLVLLAGLSVSLWQTRRALLALAAEQQARQDETQARQQAFAALRSMTEEVVERKFTQGTVLTDDDRAFLRRVIEQFDAFAAIKGDDADSRAVRAEGRLRVGNMRHTLGELEEAEQDYDQALGIYQQLVADFPSRPEFRRALASSHNRRGLLLSETGRPREAEQEYDRALSLQKRLAADFPSRPEFRQELAGSHNNRGNLLRDTGHPNEAEQEHDQALGIQKQLAADFPSRPEFRQDLASSHSNRGLLLRATGRPREAEQEYDQALGIQKRLVADFPSRPEFRRDLARSHNNRGNLLRARGRPREAEQEYDQALGIQKRLAADFPSRPEFRHELARSHNNRGILLRARGRPREAEQDFDQALGIQKQLAADFPSRPEFRQELARSHHNRGNLLSATGRLKEAEQDYDQALGIQKQLAADFPSRPEFRRDLAGSHSNRGLLLETTGRSREAEQEYDQALSIQKRLAADFPNQPDRHNELAGTCGNLALLHQQQGNPVAAKRLLLEGRPHHLAALKANPRHPTYRQLYRNHLGVLTRVQAGLLEQSDAVRTAETRRDLGWDAPADAYDAACFLSQCVPIVAQHDQLDAQQRQEAARFYGDAAMKLLRQAVSKGFKDVPHLKKDTDLNPLRQREDFQKLVAELAGKGK